MFQQILEPIAGSLVVSAVCAALPHVLLGLLIFLQSTPVLGWRVP